MSRKQVYVSVEGSQPPLASDQEDLQMRKLVLKMSVSLDGYVGGPNGEIDWLFKNLDEGATAWIADTVWQAGVHIMGSHTYQDMAAYWFTSTELLAAPM